MTPGGDRMHNFVPTMNHKRDLPQQLHSDGQPLAAAPAPRSPPVPQPPPVPAPVSPPPAENLQRQDYGNPATPPPNDIENETDSSDDDLPRMPDTDTSEEEIDNNQNIEGQPQVDFNESPNLQQPFFANSFRMREDRTRRSFRIV